MTKKNKYMRGQGLPEYALLLALVAIVLLTAVTSIGQTLSVTFGTIMAMF
jgi:Flp pilus assembly pilin Flp